MLQRNARLSLLLLAAAAIVFASPAAARAQHLWWDLKGESDATRVYGEITVLATHSWIYYCGANWHPGEPAGGYCGIQHNDGQERRTIFSIWDTTTELHPQVTEGDPLTISNRFGGEGTGAHTHMLWPWKVGQTFQFFVEKSAGARPDTTNARYYLFDPRKQKWLHSATIESPNGGKKSVATIGGGLNSFLENFSGKDRTAPKLALYRLWLGRSIEHMKCLTRARGDGTWGELHDAYFLAEGGPEELRALFSKVEKDYGKPLFGGRGKELPAIADKPMPASVVKSLKDPPRAAPPKSARPQ